MNIPDDRALTTLLLTQDLSAKYAGWDTQLVSSLPNVRQIPELVFGGSFSYTFPVRRMRALISDYAIPLGEQHATPSGVAREYLKMNYPARRRAFQLQRVAILQKRHAPAYVLPGVYHDMVYVDIKAAYWSIMSLVGWDVDYYPEHFVLAGRPPLDYPYPDNKLARNCLFSASMLTTIELWNGHAWSYHTRGSALINYSLVAMVMDILNALAWEALECGAVYIHTDGYIMPEAALAEFQRRTQDYGLEARVKHRGMSAISAIGSYTIGDHISKPFGAVKHDRPLQNLQMVKRSFLRRELSFIADRKTAQHVYNDRRK